MNATKITITSPEQEQELRRQVRGTLLVDAKSPGMAYSCGNCGATLLFAPSDHTIDGDEVHCTACGATNALT